MTSEIGDIALMGDSVKKILKRCGKNVIIRPLAKIANPEVVEIGDNAIVDDFTLLIGGKGMKIGRNTHIASFVSVIGGGIFELGDFAGVSAGSRIITGSDDFSGASMTNPSIPEKYKPKLHQGFVKIGNHAVLGTNTVVHPDVTIGEGAVTGSHTLVVKDLKPWTIYFGIPAREHRKREKGLLKLEKQYLANG